MSTPFPPAEFQSWLDYAVATMDVRGAQLDCGYHEFWIGPNDRISGNIWHLRKPREIDL